VLDWTQEYSLSHTTKQRLAWTSTKPEPSTIPPRVPKACLEPILTMADNKDEQASGGALTTNTPEDVKGHAGDIRSAREGAEEGNKFQQAVAAWRTLDLSKLVSTLDVAASELVSHQRDSLLKRKDLAQKTKDFKKLDDAAKLLDIKDLLKSYQGYIDVLTNHNKTISSAFMQAYTPLSEAPDPYPLLDASIDSLVTVEEVVPKLESENERLQKQLNKLNTQLEDSEKQLEEERNKRQSSEGSQDSRIKEVEQSWSAVLKEKEDNWTAKEQSLEEKVESQDRILKELKASYEVSQRLEKTGEETPDTGRNAATAAELELANSELERTSARLAEIEARNEQMRVELAQSASQSSGRSTAVEDEPAYLRLRSENSSLLRRIDNARYDKESETNALESKLRGIEREVNALKADRESLQTRVQKWSDYDEVKRELEMLRSIEFAAVDEADLEPSEAPSANGNADKSKGETLEQLLIARNKKLSNELTDLRVSNNELQKQLEELQEDFSTTNADLEKAQNLNASLENDLQRTQQEASNAFETMSVAGTYTSRFPKSAYGSKRGGGTSPTSSIIGGFDPSSGSGSPLRPGEGVGGGSGILPMVTAQRDRFKKKIGELEQELQKQYQTVSTLRSEVSSLQKDNLSLYEKTRYVSTYNRGAQQSTSGSAYGSNPNPSTIQVSSDSTSSGLSLDRYRSTYESNISPFAAFRGRESARAMKRMSLPERAVFQITRLVLQTRTSRNLFAMYCLALHLLVFTMLYWMGSADMEQHASNLGGAAGAGAAALAGAGAGTGGTAAHGDWTHDDFDQAT
jgi:homeobox protein cut-like